MKTELKSKTLTANQLHKMLGVFIDKGYKRTPVCINKDTFTHALESDGCVILAREIREKIAASDDKMLEVVA